MVKFCDSLTLYNRRDTNAVHIGNVTVGGSAPIIVQSMTNTDTQDTAACVDQILKIRAAGGKIVRLTAQGRPEGLNLANIVAELDRIGSHDIGIVADIHFTPDVAEIAAQSVDKVRINPGNYRDTGGQLIKLIELCRQRGVALRIGVNHGSLAQHIVDRLGDTPEGMVASAMEFLEVCQNENFDQVVVSMKSSNVRVMVYAYRLLVAAMRERGMNYPLHLGVTEAGDGADARIKSAAGIGALLADGIGDTIRVSLTEPPENEIPVAQAIVDYFAERDTIITKISAITDPSIYHCTEYSRRESNVVGRLGGNNVPLLHSELSHEELSAIDSKTDLKTGSDRIIVITATSSNPTAEWRAEILNMIACDDRRPVILHRQYNEIDLETLQIKAAADMGALFLDGLADGIYIENSNTHISQEQINNLSLSILQATRVRISKTEYIACPGCGRTLYDLQTTLGAIRSRTSHLTGLKIGVMGCIVNGPGEMADADYGYVGSGRGRITLYRGKEVVKRNIPEAEALDALIDLIKTCGDWKDE